MFYNRYRRFLGGAAVALILVVAMSTTSQGISPWTQWVGVVIAPFTWSGEMVAGMVNGVAGDVGQFAGLARDNQSLRRKVAVLSLENGRLVRAEEENVRLRALLGLKDRPGFPSSVAATVIARSPSQWFSYVVINKGAVDGLRVGLPVTDSRGVVGEVQSVTSGTATVLLLTDPESGAGVMDRRTGEDGVLVGGLSGTEYFKVEFFSRNAAVKVGDPMETSGLGKVFPPGLAVGKVAKVGYQNYGLVKYTLVEPAAGMNALFNVLVLTGAGAGVNGG